MGFVAQCVPDGSHDGIFWGVWYEFILSWGRGDWEVDGVGEGYSGKSVKLSPIISMLIYFA